jgi:hypothetical protein
MMWELLTRGFRACERLVSVQVTVEPPPFQPPVAAGGGSLDPLRGAPTGRFGADSERLASELVRGDLGGG